MAVTSGSFQTTKYSIRGLQFNWWIDRQDIAGNYTVIGWNFKGYGGGTTWYYTLNGYLNINGSRVFTQNSTKVQLSDGTVLASGTTTIYHNDNGTKTFSADGGATIYNYGTYETGSGSWELPTIPRYASITKFDVAKRNETSVNFTWEASKACDAVQYSVNGGSWTNGVYPTTTISGLSPNTSYNIKIRVKATDSQLWTESTTKSITTYKAPTNSLNSKTETTIKVNWSIDDTADYIWYSKDNGSNWTAVGSANATSGTYEIKSLSANTSYNIKTRVRRKSSQTTYDTSTLAVTTYDYPHCTDSPSFTIGNAMNITIYNPLGRNCTCTMYGDDWSVIYTGNGWTGTSIGGFNTAGIIANLYKSIPSKTSGTYHIKIQYNGVDKDKVNAGTYSIKGTEVPTFSNFTYADTNTAVTGVTGNNQILVKGLSNLRVIISSANKMVANNSATAKSYTATIDTLSKSANYSSSDLNIDVGTVVNSGTKRLNVTAYDSRNLSKVAYKDITVMDYAKPVINASVSRLNNFENQTTLKVSGTYTRLTINNADKNTITKVQYRYRETNGTWSGWTTLNTTVTAGKFTCSDVILSLDNTKSFEFEIQAIDKLQTNTASPKLAVGQAIFLISSNKKTCYINGQELIMYDVVDTW